MNERKNSTMANDSETSSFEAIVIANAHASTIEKIKAILLTDDFDELPKEQRALIDGAITAALAIGGYVGAYLFSMGVRPNHDEQARFAESFPSICMNLRELMNNQAQEDEDRYYGIAVPSRANSMGLSIGWTILIVDQSGKVMLRSEPITADVSKARKIVIDSLEANGGSAFAQQVIWCDSFTDVPEPVRDVYFAEIEAEQLAT